jgi:hypothetical protein
MELFLYFNLTICTKFKRETAKKSIIRRFLTFVRNDNAREMGCVRN